MQEYFEVVIFTAADQYYADWALGQIGAEGIRHRLYH
jgi:hypothetical protein